MKQIQCAHCGRLFDPNPRVKDQHYCSDKECQRARKRLWQRQRLATDPDYKANQKDSQKTWREKNPDYWREYRERNPQYAEHNRNRQRERRRGRGVAKMDESVMDLPLAIRRLFHHPGIGRRCKDGRVSQESAFDPGWLAAIAKRCKIELDGLTEASSFNVEAQHKEASHDREKGFVSRSSQKDRGKLCIHRASVFTGRLLCVSHSF